MAGDKTEKATPKKRDETRRKGQVAKSADLNGAVVLLAGLFALSASGPAMAARLEDCMSWAFGLAGSPEVVTHGGISALLLTAGKQAGLAVAPVAVACLASGLIINLAQVRWRPSTEALKPQPSRLNPITGAKNIFGPNSLVEGGKSVAKVGAVGAIVAMSLAPKLSTYGGLVGIEPARLGAALSSQILSVAQRAAIAYLFIGLFDYAWQKHRMEKSMRMDKQEVKEEAKQQAVPAEVRAQMRRRQMSAARARMMSAVPTADVVITNPTHFAVALKYTADRPAPVVVAKGQDLVALRIRELAKEAGVAVVPDPPLARALHAAVDVEQMIPEELFGAVAQVLAFVYRTAGRRLAASA